jgi:hypothetical protein
VRGADPRPQGVALGGIDVIERQAEHFVENREPLRPAVDGAGPRLVPVDAMQDAAGQLVDAAGVTALDGARGDERRFR